MAIEYTMLARCDRCGEIIETAAVKKTAIDSTRWTWEHKWTRTGVLQGLPNLCGKRKLYCAKCAGS